MVMHETFLFFFCRLCILNFCVWFAFVNIFFYFIFLAAATSRELRSVVAHNRNIVVDSANEKRRFNVTCNVIKRTQTLLTNSWLRISFAKRCPRFSK